MKVDRAWALKIHSCPPCCESLNGHLLGTLGGRYVAMPGAGEPTVQCDGNRTALFQTRALAREYSKKSYTSKYSLKTTPVRVRITIEVIE
jgi:hypothetical protein